MKFLIITEDDLFGCVTNNTKQIVQHLDQNTDSTNIYRKLCR